jgi:hypothetical protein
MEPNAINSNALNELNGVYSNQPMDSIIFDGSDLKTLLLKPFYTYASDEERDFTGEIELNQLSDKRLMVSYTDETGVRESKTLKGKFENGFFTVRRKFRPIGVPIIWYSYQERRILIGLEDNNLIIKTGRYEFGQLLLIFNGEKEELLKDCFKKQH